jgi:hypothetical protein
MERTEWQAFTQLAFMMRSPGSDCWAPPLVAKTSAQVATADETMNTARPVIR